jgi:hypothetical protein
VGFCGRAAWPPRCPRAGVPGSGALELGERAHHRQPQRLLPWPPARPGSHAGRRGPGPDPSKGCATSPASRHAFSCATVRRGSVSGAGRCSPGSPARWQARSGPAPGGGRTLPAWSLGDPPRQQYRAVRHPRGGRPVLGHPGAQHHRPHRTHHRRRRVRMMHDVLARPRRGNADARRRRAAAGRPSTGSELTWEHTST